MIYIIFRYHFQYIYFDPKYVFGLIFFRIWLVVSVLELKDCKTPYFYIFLNETMLRAHFYGIGSIRELKRSQKTYFCHYDKRNWPKQGLIFVISSSSRVLTKIIFWCKFCQNRFWRLVARATFQLGHRDAAYRRFIENTFLSSVLQNRYFHRELTELIINLYTITVQRIPLIRHSVGWLVQTIVQNVGATHRNRTRHLPLVSRTRWKWAMIRC